MIFIMIHRNKPIIQLVKLFYTHLSYSNGTEFLFKEAIKNICAPDYSKILYLSPTSIKGKEAQKMFHQLQLNKCYIPPEITTISQYCKKLYSIYGDKRMIKNPLIPIVLSRLSRMGIGFSKAMADFISDVKQLYPDISIDSIKLTFGDIFHKLNIPESVTKVAMNSFEIFKKYQILMDSNGLVDEDDVMNAAAEFKSQQNFETQALRPILIIDGFSDLTASEKNVLKGLIQSSECTLIAIPYDPRFKELTEQYISFLKGNFTTEEVHITDHPSLHASKSFVYHSYPGIEEEVEGIVRNIKSLYVSGMFRDLQEMAVVFPDLNKYSATVERVFRKYGVPYNILDKKQMGKMEPFLNLFSLLDSVAEGYPRIKFSQFLSSRYFKKIPDSLKKWIPSLSLQSGIVSGKEAWLNFISDGSELLDMSQIKEQKTIQTDLKWVFKKLQPLSKIVRGATFDTYASLLNDILGSFGFLQDSSVIATKTALLQTTKELLEQMSFLDSLHLTSVSLSEFADILRHILNASYVEADGMGVRIMDFSSAVGLSFRYIYFGGLVDDDMPERLKIDYILPDSVKKELGMLNFDRHIEIQRFNFQRLTTPFILSASHRSNIHLSYPLMDGDNMFLPSSFLYSGQETKLEIPGIFSTEEYLISSGKKPLSAYISEIKARCPLSPSNFNRVTDVDAYRVCPRRFFIEKILKLKPMTVKGYDLEAITIGNIAHKVMEQIIREPFDDLKYLTDKAKDIVDAVVKNKKISNYWKRLMSDTFIEILPDIYEKELDIRKDDYIFTEAEKTITGEPIKGVKLKGKIDRFDKIGNSVQIIDYKTGKAEINCTQALKGNENLQLFLYAAMMKDQGYKVNRVGIYSLTDIEVKWCPGGKGKGKGKEGEGQGIDDYIAASLQFLEDAAKSIRKGDFRAEPLKEHSCRNCHEYAFCPYQQ